MPTYVYRCTEGHEFEVQQGINDEPLHECQQEMPRTHHSIRCYEPVERVPQRGFFKIGGAGVHSPGFK